MVNKAYALDGKDIYEIEDKINDFCKTHKVFSWSIFPTRNGYDGLIGFEEKTAEPIIDKRIGDRVKDKDEPATDKQLFYLRQMGIKIKEPISKSEAYRVIKEYKEKGK